eukprot:scaffold6652_cov62-Phaeocystis_antarctica.AAC.4
MVVRVQARAAAHAAAGMILGAIAISNRAPNMAAWTAWIIDEERAVIDELLAKRIVGRPRLKTVRKIGDARHVRLIDLGDGEDLVGAVLGVRGSVDPLEQGQRGGRVDWEENARPAKAVRGLKRGLDAPVAGEGALPEADG